MNEFLSSIKADLTDSRVRVVALALVAALVAALAYAALGGGSSKPATAPAANPVPSLPSLAGIAVTAAQPNRNEAVAETTSGAPKQHGGPSRNPFEPLPGANATSTSSSSGGSASKGSGSSSSSTGSASKTPHTASTHTGAPESSSSSGAGGAPAATPTQPVQPAKKRVVIHFHAAAEFGVVPAPAAPGAAAPAPQLKTYKDMKLNEPLPSKQNSQLVYLGVVLRTGKDAVFGLTGEAILHGEAKCVPSAAHCQAIELQPGQSETLESFEANGTPVTYKLKLLTISRSVSSASAARAHAATAAWGKTKARRSLLHRLGLAAAFDTRAAREAAGLVPAGSAFAALAGVQAPQHR